MIRHNGIEIDRRAMTISHAGQILRHGYTGRQTYFRSPDGGGYRFKAWERLILAPASPDELFAYIFGDNAEGGPDSGRHIWYVRFQQWRPHFVRMKLVLVSEKRAGIMHYQLVPDVV